MGAVDRTPDNQNYLSVIGYNFILQRAPNIEFFIQDANVPEVSLPAVDVPNPFVNFPLHGDHLDYGALNIQFRVDENMEGYAEIYNWLLGLGFPKNFEQHKTLTDADRDALRQDGVYSDISLTFLTSLKNPNIQFNFRDAWPTSISGWEMSNQIEDVMYADCTVNFRYSYFDLEVIRA